MSLPVTKLAEPSRNSQRANEGERAVRSLVPEATRTVPASVAAMTHRADAPFVTTNVRGTLASGRYTEWLVVTSRWTAGAAAGTDDAGVAAGAGSDATATPTVTARSAKPT